jgi:alpha-glucosidase
MRNHAVKDCRRQEPWAFSKKAMQTARHYIRLRYKLLPYLYNLFIDQEELGDPILRPLIYHFDDPRFVNESHSFMLGSSILQAPNVTEGADTVNVNLPEGQWFDARTGDWVKGGGTRRVTLAQDETPLYIANGAILPMQVGTPKNSKKEFRRVEIHLFVKPGTEGSTSYSYRADDGLSYGYRKGKRSEVALNLSWSGRTVKLTWEHTRQGFGAIRPTFVVHGALSLAVNGKEVDLAPTRLRLTGRQFAARKAR